MSESVILDDGVDENYEPSDKEIEEYGTYLGIQVNDEKHLLWIAKEGLKAPLPPNWKPCQAPDSSIYYFNFVTGESTWEHPMDDHYKDLVVKERSKTKKEDGSLKKVEISSSKPVKELPKVKLDGKPPLSLKALKNAPLKPLASLSPKKTEIDGVKKLDPIKSPISPTPKQLAPIQSQSKPLESITTKVPDTCEKKEEEKKPQQQTKVTNIPEKQIVEEAKTFYVDPNGFDLYSSEEEEEDNEESVDGVKAQLAKSINDAKSEPISDVESTSLSHREDELNSKFLESPIISSVTLSHSSSKTGSPSSSPVPKVMEKGTSNPNITSFESENLKSENQELHNKVNQLEQKIAEKDLLPNTFVSPQFLAEQSKKWEEENSMLKEKLSMLEKRMSELQNNPNISGKNVSEFQEVETLPSITPIPTDGNPIPTMTEISNSKFHFIDNHQNDNDVISPMETFLKEMKCRMEKNEETVKELKSKLKHDREQLVCANYGGVYEEIFQQHTFEENSKDPVSDAEIVSLQGEWLKSMDFHLKQSERQVDDLRHKMNEDVLTRRRADPHDREIIHATAHRANVPYMDDLLVTDESSKSYHTEINPANVTISNNTALLGGRGGKENFHQNNNNNNHKPVEIMTEKKQDDFFDKIKDTLKHLESYSTTSNAERLEKIDKPVVSSSNLIQLTDEFRKELEVEKQEIEDAKRFIDSQSFRLSSPFAAPTSNTFTTATERFLSRYEASPERASPVRSSQSAILAQIKDELERGEQVLSSQSKFLREYVGKTQSNHPTLKTDNADVYIPTSIIASNVSKSTANRRFLPQSYNSTILASRTLTSSLLNRK